jgi:hypothetical protein
MTSCLRIGSDVSLTCEEWPGASGYCSTFTAAILPPVIVTATCTGPYTADETVPVYVPSLYPVLAVVVVVVVVVVADVVGLEDTVEVVVVDTICTGTELEDPRRLHQKYPPTIINTTTPTRTFFMCKNYLE